MTGVNKILCWGWVARFWWWGRTFGGTNWSNFTWGHSGRVRTLTNESISTLTQHILHLGLPLLEKEFLLSLALSVFFEPIICLFLSDTHTDSLTHSRVALGTHKYHSATEWCMSLWLVGVPSWTRKSTTHSLAHTLFTFISDPPPLPQGAHTEVDVFHQASQQRAVLPLAGPVAVGEMECAGSQWPLYWQQAGNQSVDRGVCVCGVYESNKRYTHVPLARLSAVIFVLYL